MMRAIRNAVKGRLYYFLVKERLAPLVGIQQRHLFHHYQESARTGNLPGIENTGFKVFSQFEEDGKLVYIFSIIGIKNKTFIEIGADDGINSNCANLYFHFGFHGLFIDGNATSVKRGRRFYARHPNPWYYQPKFVCAMVKKENINQLVEEAGYAGEVDLLSIDIDGNDYWVWEALEVASPRVVIIETHVEFGFHDIVVPYDPDYVFPGRHPVYHGASPVAMVKLARRKGYRLVGANAYGSNFIFVKEELCGEHLPEKSVEEVLVHPSAMEALISFDEVKDMEYIRG
ncbi:MAG: hypothetical protein R6V49_09135 [Bacteroidales bacterium]